MLALMPRTSSRRCARVMAVATMSSYVSSSGALKPGGSRSFLTRAGVVGHLRSPPHEHRLARRRQVGLDLPGALVAGTAERRPQVRPLDDAVEGDVGRVDDLSHGPEPVMDWCPG